MKTQEVTKGMKVIPTRKTKGGPTGDIAVLLKEHPEDCCVKFLKEHGFLTVGSISEHQVILQCPDHGFVGCWQFDASDFEPAEIEVGDVVKVKANCFYEKPRGKLGVVVSGGSGSVGIDFGAGFDGHKCHGAISTDTGYFISSTDLDLVTKGKKPEAAKPKYLPKKGERVKSLKERDGDYIGEFGIVEDEYPGQSVVGVRTEAGKYAAATECEPAPAQWRPKVGDKVVFIDGSCADDGCHPSVGTIGTFTHDDGSRNPQFTWPVLGKKYCTITKLRPATVGDLVEVGDMVKIVKSLHGGGHAGETGEVTRKDAFGGTDSYGGRYRFEVFGMLYHEVEIELVSKKEDKPMLKVGDRVRATQSHCGKDLTKKVGTVKHIDGTLASVEYDEDISGHQGMHKGRNGYCWNFPIRMLEIAKEETPMFKIGDRVTPTEIMSGKDLRGKQGTVINLPTSSLVCVEFDKAMGGHSGRGKGKDGYCWEFYPRMLKQAEVVINVGERRRVRADLKVGRYDDHTSAVSNMLEYAGKIVTIKEVKSCGCIRVEDNGWNWTKSMFDPKPVTEEPISRVALVALRGTSKKYLFSIPADMKVEVGTKVICETASNPKTPGVIAEAPVEVTPDSLAFMVAGMGATLPVRPIVGIGNSRPTKGDWVKIITDDTSHDEGSVGKIVTDDRTSTPFLVSVNGEEHWCDEEDVEKVDAPVAEEFSFDKLRKTLGKEFVLRLPNGSTIDTRTL